MRTLALDWGEVRVGVAVSDPEGKIAFPLEKVIESKNAILEIKQLVQELDVGKVIVGMPKNLSGREEKSAEKSGKFAENLERAIKIPIEFVDERFSSVEAGKKLSALGQKEKEQRKVIDNIAAQIILQQYLDTKN